MMKKLSVMLLTVLLIGRLTSMVAAQSKEETAKDDKPGGVVVDVVKLSGTV